MHDEFPKMKTCRAIHFRMDDAECSRLARDFETLLNDSPGRHDSNYRGLSFYGFLGLMP